MIFQDLGEERLGLPTDVQWLLVDYWDYKSIPSALRSFGWVLPDSYWHQRFPKGGLIFEIEGMEFETVDWQFLCLGVEKLLEWSPELLNRRRVLQLLRLLHNINRQSCWRWPSGQLGLRQLLGQYI
jgi:hypothetical protein